MTKFFTAIAAAVCLASTIPAMAETGAEAAPKTQTTFVNPLFRGADPYVVKYDGLYYTIRNGEGGFVVTESRFLTRFEREETIWAEDAGEWCRYNHWAPEIHRIDGKWYVYFAAACRKGNSFCDQRTGVFEADNPFGPWRDKGLVYTGDDMQHHRDNCWAIDMTVLEVDGRRYAVWSGWDELHDHDQVDQHLYIAEMHNPWTIGKRVLLSKPELSWEQGDNIRLQEGPQVLYHGDDVFILYSTRGSWTEHYKVGCLRLKSRDYSPLDPSNWQKLPEPVFTGNERVFGVGHASLTTSPDDSEYWIYYHSKLDMQGGWENRHVYLQKFGFDSAGNPFFGPSQGGGEMERPAGEVEIEKKSK